MKEASHKRPHIILLGEGSRIINFIETGSKLVVAREGGIGRHWVSPWGDVNVLELVVVQLANAKNP